jgi:pyruvyltransferase
MTSIGSLFKRYRTRPVRAYWWRHPDPKKPNFGDELTPILVERLFNQRCVWAAPEGCEFAAAGSIIELLSRRPGDNVIKIWGSGFIFEADTGVALDRFEFHAVRGDLSRARVAAARQVAIGDPGLLMSLAAPAGPKRRFPVGILPHYVDQDHERVRGALRRLDALLIDVCDRPEVVSRNIARCSIVLSSSLHGLVVSDSYGIPNYHFQLNPLIGGVYKFLDYYSALELPYRTVDLDSIEGKAQIHDLIDQFIPRQQTVRRLQQGLIDAFPFR